ncbi:MAG: GTPase HflX [Candidatus Heimdallarchaeota archaeon]|nr:MAG: GTPase HflX [Candidatus Heimdallarchaeota archaeon]
MVFDGFMQSDAESAIQVSQECVLLLPLSLDERQKFLNEEMRHLLLSARYRVITEFELIPNNAKYFFSPHHLNEIKAGIDSEYFTELIVVGSHLTPKIHINLENFFECSVIDKFELVLEIFAERAMTEESKLQIELAQLKYEHPRERLRLMHSLGLGGAWHSEREGFFGTGENPLNEFEARMTKKESQLRKKLQILSKQREKRRHSRKRHHHDSLYVSIVGYTSAGKSTILNSITNSYSSSVSSRLFETLDTRIRSFQLEDLKIFITDTVGFIENLPTFLIDSFKSTLEESLAAEILFIVVDGSEAPEFMLRKAQISIQTINEINPQNYRIIILNKIDLLDDRALDERLTLLKNHFPEFPIIPIAAINDVQPLIDEIDEFRPKKRFKCSYSPSHQFRSFCYDFTSVEHETFENDDWEMVISLRKPKYGVEILKHRAELLGIEIKMEII